MDYLDLTPENSKRFYAFGTDCINKRREKGSVQRDLFYFIVGMMSATPWKSGMANMFMKLSWALANDTRSFLGGASRDDVISSSDSMEACLENSSDRINIH